MNLPFVEKYKGYTLKCTPQPTHDEGYLAFVIITHGTEPVHVDRAAVLDLPGFELKSEAALAALSAAIRWVDDVVPLQSGHSHTAGVPTEIDSAREHSAEADAWLASRPNEEHLRASRRTADRRGQFSDRRQIRLIDQPRPIDQLPAIGAPRRA